MNKDQVEGNWKQLKGKVKEQWGKLTDNDMTIVEGNMDQLAGRVQERYGIQRDEAEKQIKEFRNRNEDLWPSVALTVKRKRPAFAGRFLLDSHAINR